MLFVIFFFLPHTYPLFIIALPFLLFLPGYMLVSACFPNREPNLTDRIFLSICASLCIVPTIPFLLNYIGTGTGLEYIVPCIMLATVFFSAMALVRRYDSGEEKFKIGLEEGDEKKNDKKGEMTGEKKEEKNKLSWDSYNYVISLMLFSIIIALILFIVYLIPFVVENRARLNETEDILELYITPPEGNDDYPHFVLQNQTSRIKVGINYSPSTSREDNERYEIKYSLVAQVVDNLNNLDNSHGYRVSDIRYVESWDTLFIFNSTFNGYERNLTFGSEPTTWNDLFSFSFSTKGEFVLQFLLFCEYKEGDSGQPIRGVSTWIKVN